MEQQRGGQSMVQSTIEDVINDQHENEENEHVDAMEDEEQVNLI
jgi:hypothetical protein